MTDQELAIEAAKIAGLISEGGELPPYWNCFEDLNHAYMVAKGWHNGDESRKIELNLFRHADNSQCAQCWEAYDRYGASDDPNPARALTMAILKAAGVSIDEVEG